MIVKYTDITTREQLVEQTRAVVTQLYELELAAMEMKKLTVFHLLLDAERYLVQAIEEA